MSNLTQRQHYLHQLNSDMQKRPKFHNKNKRKISRFSKKK